MLLGRGTAAVYQWLTNFIGGLMSEQRQQPHYEPVRPETRVLLAILAGNRPADADVRERYHVSLAELLDRLAMLGLVDGEGVPTQRAHEVIPFMKEYISARMAVVLWASRTYGTTLATIYLVAILSSQRPFFIYPGDSRAAACSAHRSFEQKGSRSDLATLLAAFLALERVYTTEGEKKAAAFSRAHFLNFGTFRQASNNIASLRETALQLGYSLEDTSCAEADIIATFFWGYLDRMLRRNEVTNNWEAVHELVTRFQHDSLHHASKSNAELLLCVGLICLGGPTDNTMGTTFSAMSPEELQGLVGSETVRFFIESRNGHPGEPLEPCDVWYWGDQRIATRLSPMPEGPPVELLREGHVRTRGVLPWIEGCSTKLSWADLAKRTGQPDLKVQVAQGWLDFADDVQIGEGWFPVRYEDDQDRTIVVIIEHAQAVALLEQLSTERLPESWLGRPIKIEVDFGDGQPITVSIEDLGSLLQTPDKK
jgi:hypothetical protein